MFSVQPTIVLGDARRHGIIGGRREQRRHYWQKLSVGTFAQLEGYTKENDYYQPFSLYVTRARSDQPPKLSRVQMTALSEFDAASRIDFVAVGEDGIGIYKTAKRSESGTGLEVEVFLKTPVVFNGGLTPGPRMNQ